MGCTDVDGRNASTVAELLLVRHVAKGMEVGISLLVGDEAEQAQVVVTGPFINFLLHNHFITEKF